MIIGLRRHGRHHHPHRSTVPTIRCVLAADLSRARIRKASSAQMIMTMIDVTHTATRHVDNRCAGRHVLDLLTWRELNFSLHVPRHARMVGKHPQRTVYSSLETVIVKDARPLHIVIALELLNRVRLECRIVRRLRRETTESTEITTMFHKVQLQRLRRSLTDDRQDFFEKPSIVFARPKRPIRLRLIGNTTLIRTKKSVSHLD